MTLTVDGAQFEIAQATPTHLYLRTPVEIKTGTGELAISIDGAFTQQTVRLLNRSQLSSPSVPYARIVWSLAVYLRFLLTLRRDDNRFLGVYVGALLNSVQRNGS